MSRLVATLFAAAAVCVVTAIWLLVVGLTLPLPPSAAQFNPVAANATSAALIATYLTAASVMGALGGWLFSNGVTIHTKLREKASDFLRSTQQESKFLDSLIFVGRVATDTANKTALEDSSQRAALYASPEGRIFVSHLRDAMNFFEEMAIFVRRGAVDEQLLRDFYAGMLCRLYPTYALFAPLMKNIPINPSHTLGRSQRPDLFCNVDWLYSRWHRRYSEEFYYGYPVGSIELTGLDTF